MNRPRDGSYHDWRDRQTLLLAAEVVSPRSAKKRTAFPSVDSIGAKGIRKYWVVDGHARLVEVWHPEDERPRIVTDVFQWAVIADASEVEILLDCLFTDLPA
jgi:Uma2 family endonuclease